MPEVRILSGPESGRAIALERGSILRIGRKLPPPAPGALVTDIEVDDPKLSRLHCEVLDVDGAWVLRDRGSSNGTFLNGKRVHERVLRPGDRVQLGATELELAPLEGEDLPPDEPAEAVEAKARAGARRKVVRRSTPWPALAGVAGASGLVIALVLASRRAPDPEVSTAAVAKAPEVKGAAPAGGSAPAEPAPAEATRSDAPEPPPAAGREAPAPAREEIAARLASGEYRKALDFLDDLELRGGGFDLEPLRQEVLARAIEDLEAAAADAEREAAAGRGQAERARLEKVIAALPADLSARGAAALARVRGAASGGGAARIRMETSGDRGIRASLEEIAASLRRLEGSKDEGAKAAPWEEICSRIARVVAESRSRPAWVAHRKAARTLFLKAKTASLERADLSSSFAAKRAARSGGDLRLEYAFESSTVPADLRSAPGGSLEIAGKALVLQGSCRLLEGDPFEGALTVRLKLPAGGYGGASPNVGIAVFTSARDVLVVPGRPPTSLLGFVGSAPGKEPRDWALFALGYKAPVLSYADRVVEKIYVTGLTDPLDLPANAVIFGRSGKPLHTDSRECPWAVKSAQYAGPLTIEVAVTAEAVSWKVNGKDVVGGEGPVLDRWLQGPPRMGSVTLHASGGPVKIIGLEVLGRLRRGWMEQRFKARAEEEYRRVDPE